MNTTRVGKIARLPKTIREELNRRLENGELAKTILAWLNQLPEVQKLITDQFGGHPIRAQNISQWRAGGYLDWQRHQLLREQTRWTAEQAAELGINTTGASISIAEDIATVISAELALHVHDLGAIKNPKQRFRRFRMLSRELSRLRRDDQRAISNQLRSLKRQPTTEPTEEEQEKSEPPVATQAQVETTPGGASVLASRADIETDAHEITAAPEPTTVSIMPVAPDPQTSSSCILPSALSEPNSPTHKLINPQTPPPPLPPNPTKSQHKIFSIPIRGRRFTCIEG
jgi:hypothetical protein